MSRLLIAIPAYNEEEMVGEVISSLPSTLPEVTEIVKLVVDDGSTDRTVERALEAGAMVISHLINTGVGGAIQTAMSYAETEGFDYLVTLDADGQHRGSDVPLLLEPVAEGRADVVVGARQFGLSNTPVIRMVGNWMMNLVTRVLARGRTRDSQSGFRAFSRQAILKLHLRFWGMEHNSEVVILTHRFGLRYTEVAIPSVYTTYSRKKGQSTWNALSVLFHLLDQR